MPLWDLTSYYLQHLRDAEAESNRVHDIVIGVVVDIKDPDHLQRVKVRFPSLGPDATWWCSRVAPGAGKDRGWFTAPEIDDEVVVGFEHGELARPIILGAIWNGKDAPPDGNPDGDNPRRTIASKSGHVVLFDDKDGTLTIADGAGIGVVTIAKDGGITIEANQGDVAMQAKTELAIYAGQIEITATGTIDLHGKATGVDASGASVKLDGNMVALKGSTIDLNPGGVPKAAKASGEVAEVPGSDPGTNSPAQVSGGDAGVASGGGGASGGSSDTGAAGGGGATPGPSAAADRGADEASEPQPALISAMWSEARVTVGTAVSLGAMCLDLAGQAARFQIRTADTDEVVATVHGTCGDAVASATWTTPKDPPAARFVFTASVGDKQAESGVLTLVKPFTATLMLDELPAFGVEVELETVETGDRVRAIADADGLVDIPEAAIGTWNLHLISAEDA